MVDLEAERAKYVGDEARLYDSKREKKPVWKAEQKAVEDLVHTGPVLDVPIGTGRYLSIYEAKGLWPHGLDVSEDMIAEALLKRPKLEYKVGSILDIPHADQSFGTAVCTRLLNWFNADGMKRAVSELLRVAPRVVMSIRLGVTPQQLKATHTHSWDDFLDALKGAWIKDQRLVVEEGSSGDYYMMGVQKPTWQDVVDQFAWNRASLQTLADEWCERYGVPAVEMKDRPVRCEYWTGERLGREIDKMAELEPRLLPSGSPSVEKPPRKDGLPITILDFGEGRLGQVDGRHRVNLWRKQPAKRYPVFVCSLY